ncbi:MAG: OmpA family protein [Paludibacteraceae bacterium]
MRTQFVKIFAIAAISLTCTFAYAQEADTISVAEDVARGVHPWNQKENGNAVPYFSNWSLILDAGFNSFDGDFSSEMKHPIGCPSIGLGVEYTFTPYIGIGLNYMFDMYRVTGMEGKSADILLNGMMHKAGLYLPVDLVSCFAPRAQHRLFNIQLLAGGGLAWYTNDVYYTQEARGNTLNVEPSSMNGEYKFCPYVNVGVNLEFNIGRSVGLGIKGVYNYFTRDDVDGRYGGASVNNDGIVDVTLSLRYKINAHKRSHERNVTSGAQETQLARKADGLPVGEGVSAEEVAREIIDKGLLKAARDTMLLVRKDTLVQTNKVVVETESEHTSANNQYFVYFASGKAALGDQGLIAIQQAAAQLRKDEKVYALIVGHCDNTGSDRTNDVLSRKRAQAVEQELIAEYEINPDRLLAYGAGKIVGKHSKAAYTPNRRVEIQLLSETEFVQRKQALRAEQEAKVQSANKETEEVGQKAETPNVEPVSAPQEVETLAEESPAVLDTVVVTKGTTLARLARKYYNMRFDLWTYIYEANRDVITNPDKLKEGTTLVIPALTEEQLKAPSDEVAALH